MEVIILDDMLTKRKLLKLLKLLERLKINYNITICGYAWDTADIDKTIEIIKRLISLYII